MAKKLFKFFIYAYLISSYHNLIAQSRDPVLVIATAVVSTIPNDLDNSWIDNKIKKLKDDLPDKLEKQIFDLAKGRIKFIERDQLMEFKDVIDYENERAFIKAVGKKIKIDAVLLTKIDKVDQTRITITGKITLLNRIKLSLREITTYLEPQSVFDSNLRSLARAIIDDVFPKVVVPPLMPKNWLVAPKIPLLIVNRKISLLTSSFAISTVGTFLWYQNEDDMARQHYDAYKLATTTQDAMLQRISAEKAISRSEVARCVY